MTKLARVIKKHRMSQSDLARKLDVSPAAVWRSAKTGIKTTTTAKRYAAALKCAQRDILE